MVSLSLKKLTGRAAASVTALRNPTVNIVCSVKKKTMYKEEDLHSLVSKNPITIPDTSQIMFRGMALSRSFRSGFRYRI